MTQHTHTEQQAPATPPEFNDLIKQQLVASLGETEAKKAQAEIDKVQGLVSEMGDISANPGLFFSKMMTAFEEKKTPLEEAIDLLESAQDVMVLPGTPAKEIAELAVVAARYMKEPGNIQNIAKQIVTVQNYLKKSPAVPQVQAAIGWCNLGLMCLNAAGVASAQGEDSPLATQRAQVALQACRVGAPQISPAAAAAIKQRAQAARQAQQTQQMMSGFMTAAVKPAPAPQAPRGADAAIDVTPAAPAALPPATAAQDAPIQSDE